MPTADRKNRKGKSDGSGAELVVEISPRGLTPLVEMTKGRCLRYARDDKVKKIKSAAAKIIAAARLPVYVI